MSNVARANQVLPEYAAKAGEVISSMADLAKLSLAIVEDTRNGRYSKLEVDCLVKAVESARLCHETALRTSAFEMLRRG